MLRPADEIVKHRIDTMAMEQESPWFVYYMVFYQWLDGDFRAFEIQERSRYPRGHNITRQLKRARDYWRILDSFQWRNV